MVSSRNTVSRCHATHCPASPQVYPLACHTDLLLWHVQLLVTSSKDQASFNWQDMKEALFMNRRPTWELGMHDHGIAMR